jgi:hypothetical protein
MAEISEDEKKRIIDALNAKLAVHPCPRCGNPSFTLLPGYINQPLSEQISQIVLGGLTVPTIAVACTNCGFLSLHAAGVLGLIPPQPQTPPTAETPTGEGTNEPNKAA